MDPTTGVAPSCPYLPVLTAEHLAKSKELPFSGLARRRLLGSNPSRVPNPPPEHSVRFANRRGLSQRAHPLTPDLQRSNLTALAKATLTLTLTCAVLLRQAQDHWRDSGPSTAVPMRARRSASLPRTLPTPMVSGDVGAAMFSRTTAARQLQTLLTDVLMARPGGLSRAWPRFWTGGSMTDCSD